MCDQRWQQPGELRSHCERRFLTGVQKLDYTLRGILVQIESFPWCCTSRCYSSSPVFSGTQWCSYIFHLGGCCEESDQPSLQYRRHSGQLPGSSPSSQLRGGTWKERKEIEAMIHSCQASKLVRKSEEGPLPQNNIPVKLQSQLPKGTALTARGRLWERLMDQNAHSVLSK